MKYAIGFLLALVMLSLSPCGYAEEPTVTSICAVLKDPASFNHKLVKISGDVSRGFEDFTISADRCDDRAAMWIWLEFGGSKGSQTVYCCGVSTDPHREEILVVEGVETSLVQDAMLKKFDALTKRRGKARVTIVGRYFSGTRQQFPGGTYWVGYGHMGMGTLLVIQQVIEVSK